jgi:hypothetical protein
MSFDEVAGKFGQCAVFAGWDAQRAGEVIALVREFEQLPALAPLMAVLCRP